MTSLKRAAAMLLLALAVLLAACSGNQGTGTPGSAKVNTKVVFLNSSSHPVFVQDARIAHLWLEVIPADTATSYSPPSIDLSSTTTGSCTVTGLTDNASYLFRVTAYDAANALIWAGEIPAVVKPSGTTVTVASLQITGTSAGYLTQAKSYLAARNLSSAQPQLMLATLTDRGNLEAKFLYALTRLSLLYQGTGSPGSTQLDSIRKILTASGVGTVDLSAVTGKMKPFVPPAQLPSTTPTVGQLQSYLRDYMFPEIDTTLSYLASLPASFSVTVSPAIFGLTGSSVVVDTADVQTLMTLLYSAKASLALICAYNFDANVVALVNTRLSTGGSIGSQDRSETTSILQGNGQFGVAQEAGLLPTARNAYASFVAAYQSALTAMAARPYPLNHMFTLDTSINGGNHSINQQKAQSTLAGVRQIQNALDGQTTWSPPLVPAPGSKAYRFFQGSYGFKSYSALRPASNSVVKLSQFFDATQPVNLRTAFVDCPTASMFKDATLAGIYPLGYVPSPLYHMSAPPQTYSSYGTGAWDVDNFYNMSPAARQALINGVCGAGTVSSVSGRVTYNGTGVGGVIVSTAAGYTTTDGQGNYTISALKNGSYTLIASGPYTFAPTSIAVTVSGANLTGQNFTAGLAKVAGP